MKTSYFLLLVILFALNANAEKVVRYDLFVTDTIIKIKNKDAHAIAINGQVPAPTLVFTEGDTAEIYVHNEMEMHETSIHWHGLILPNSEDGVPYLTNPPIKAKSTYKFKFPIVQNGTYWYHSHTMLQEQIGMYGAFIINKRNKDYVPEQIILLSDWTTENPHNIERLLHNASDWFGLKKKSTQNYVEAYEEKHIGTKIENEFKRLLPMDVSDVYYEEFRINNNNYNEKKVKKGKLKLRIINGSSSTYFWLNYAGGKLTVVANDGMDVEPVEVDRMIISVAETYDVIIDVDEININEFRATAEDRTGFASFYFGNGEIKKAKNFGKLKYFEGMKMMNDMTNVNGEMNDMGMEMSLQQMDMNNVMYPELEQNDSVETTELTTLNYNMLKSPVKTTLPENVKTSIYHLKLTGNMNRYVWSIDDKTLSESDKIIIKQGENIRLIINNSSMMRHPMHLHGHFFRVINGYGEYSPLKNVLDIMPMETDTIEFNASENTGDWFFHCHILYHMMSGMGRIFSYENTIPNPALGNHHDALEKVYDDDRRYYIHSNVGIEYNGSDGEFIYANTRNELSADWRMGFRKDNGQELEAHLGRYLDNKQFLLLYAGVDIRFGNAALERESLFGQLSAISRREVICVGVIYKLPLLVNMNVRFDQNGKLRFQFDKSDIAINSNIRLSMNWNTDYEFRIKSKYIINNYISFSMNYDSEMKFGAGLTFTY